MQWINTQEQALPLLENSVLTIGNFDGVHLGHQTLVKELLAQATKYQIPSVVCTFKPHPLTVVRPEASVYRLFDYRDQAEQMEALGVDFLILEKFTKQMSLLTGQEFLDNFIFKHFNPKHIVVGYDFSFGKNKGADYAFLSNYCKDRNVGLTLVEAVKIDDEIISSTRIRKHLEQGDLVNAEICLGRKYYLRGPVKVGFQRGRTLGFPTANISPDIDFVPKKGVYFSRVILDGKIFNSITNIGVNPTFENNENMVKVETHIFDFDLDIYGKQIHVELHQFCRGEIKFNGLNELQTQIEADIAKAKEFFKRLGR